MSKSSFEVFGLLEYDEELTFEEVQELEENIQTELKEIFRQAGAKQVNILEVADGLQMHLTFPEYNELTFKKMCSKIKKTLSEEITFKILLVDKSLVNWESYFITHESIKKKKFAF